jgi:hypothetical protein
LSLSHENVKEQGADGPAILSAKAVSFQLSLCAVVSTTAEAIILSLYYHA